MNNKSKKIISIMVIVLAIVMTNIFTAGIMSSSTTNGSDKLGKIKQLLMDNYIDKISKTQQDNMVDAEIRAMVNSLGDPYTVYMNAKEYKAFNTQIMGSFAGIGIYVGTKAGKITVAAPIEGSPAEKAGIEAGDAIIGVNGIAVTSKDMDKAVTMMLGKAGTSVNIEFYRPGKGNFNKVIVRANIVIKSVKSEMLKGKVGYIRISMFDENTAAEFKKALTGLDKQGEKGLIIDLEITAVAY